MTMTSRQLTKRVSLDKPQILRPLPGPGGRDAEWAEWSRQLGRQRFYDPMMNWLDEHPATFCLLVGILVTGLFLLAAKAMM